MTLFEKEAQAIERLKLFEPQEGQDPYYIAYSGGKDSDTILLLAKLAGVRYEAHHNLTTVDAPETVYYVKSQPEIIIDRPRLTMWQLIPKKLMPPTRLVRYCCSELKERGGEGRRVVTGVRKAESVKRKSRSGLVNFLKKQKEVIEKASELGVDISINNQGSIILNNDNTESRELVEHCSMQAKVLVNPIYDWTDKDVWEFLRYYGCKSNPLYECGFSRIGCIGCPAAAAKRYMEFNRYPKYKANYIRAFDRMIERRKERGLKPTRVSWNTGEEVFKWWMGEDPDQLTFDDIFKLEGEE